MNTSRLWLLALLALPLTCALAADPAQVATISIVRQVEVTKAPASAQNEWLPVSQNQGLRNGFGVRTLKRAQAELKFKDNSILRLNERTSLIVQEAAQMRKIQLTAGAVWVKVTRGAHVSVETPTSTATAKGTQFIVLITETGGTRVVVLEGRVGVENGGGSVDVDAGQYTETSGPQPSNDGNNNNNNNTGGNNGNPPPPPPPPAVPRELGKADLPVEQGGTVSGWWGESNVSGGVTVTAGTTVATEIRESPVSEDGIVDATLPPAEDDTTPAYVGYIADAAARSTFLGLAQRVLTPAIYASNQEPAAYTAAHGSDALTTLSGITQADIDALYELGILDVGGFVQGLVDNGGVITVALNPLHSRGALRPSAITVKASQRELALLDQTRSSTGIFLGGLAAGLIADWGHWSLSTPKFGAMLYGFSGRPGFWGARADLSGLIGQTRYAFEANALHLLNDPERDPIARLTSVAEVSHPVNANLTLFAGRRRFFHGPVFQDLMNTQLIANRYSGIGLDYTRGPWTFEGAWLYDSNPDVKDAQPGALASLDLKAAGGIFGIHAMRETDVDDGNGLTVSASLPLVRNVLDGYTEIGWQVDKMFVQTYGLYLPWLYQRTDIDLFLEYGRHARVGQGVSAIAAHKLGEMAEARVFANWAEDHLSKHSAVVVGTGLLLTYDSTKHANALMNGAAKGSVVWQTITNWLLKRDGSVSRKPSGLVYHHDTVFYPKAPRKK